MNDLKVTGRILPISEATKRRNPEIYGRNDSLQKQGVGLGDTRKVAKLECDSGHEPMAKAQLQEKGGGKFFVSITSFRRRLLDEDNLCCKFIVDLCRYAGCLPNDDPGTTKIEVTQKKVCSKEREYVRIQVWSS